MSTLAADGRGWHVIQDSSQKKERTVKDILSPEQIRDMVKAAIPLVRSEEISFRADLACHVCALADTVQTLRAEVERLRGVANIAAAIVRALLGAMPPSLQRKWPVIVGKASAFLLEVNDCAALDAGEGGNAR